MSVRPMWSLFSGARASQFDRRRVRCGYLLSTCQGQRFAADLFAPVTSDDSLGCDRISDFDDVAGPAIAAAFEIQRALVLAGPIGGLSACIADVYPQKDVGIGPVELGDGTAEGDGLLVVVFGGDGVVPPQWRDRQTQHQTSERAASHRFSSFPCSRGGPKFFAR